MNQPDLTPEHGLLAEARALLVARQNATAASVLAALAPQDPTGQADELLGDAFYALEIYAEAADAYYKATIKAPRPERAEKLEQARNNAYVRADFETAPPWSGPDRTIEASRNGPASSPRAKPPRDLRRGLQRRLRRWIARLLPEISDEVWTNWYHQPKAIALLRLLRMRATLNASNIFDTYPAGRRPRQLGPRPPNADLARTVDGTWNDPEDPMMGAAGVRFGRNTPPALSTVRPTTETLLEPNPREISRKLLTREEFQPAPFLNLLAASWIQFMTHDWFSHGPPLPTGDALIEIPLSEDDPLRQKHHATTMFVPATLPDPSRTGPEHDPPTHLSETTHWWDASQLYGSDQATADSLRAFSGGKLALDPDGRLPLDENGVEETGFRRNWWVGLSMLHELFAREHNHICEWLRTAYPRWDDQRLYDTARMITAALTAKIHTVEWTPAILPNPILKYAMNANWSGVLGDPLKKILPRSYTRRHPGLFGIVGSVRDLHGVPYAITEEFVSVYRMHPLLPESLLIRPVQTTAASQGPDQVVPLARTRNRGARKLIDHVGMETLWGTFGTSHPGALVLHNYPRFLQSLSIPGLPVYDLAAVDILRDRERGVPRYNEFRRLLQLKPIARFEDLTDDSGDVALLSEVYEGDVEALDLLVGCLAESHRPDHFAFGETAFQIFILNASRRLQADRFYTTDYRPEIYTQEGLDHIDRTTMKDVLLRHYPQLANTGLRDAKTAFHPWNTKE